jgi:hypothetical protein
MSAANNAGVETRSPASSTAIAQTAAVTPRDKPRDAANRTRKKRVHESSAEGQAVAASVLAAAENETGSINLPAEVAVLPLTRIIEPRQAIAVAGHNKNIVGVPTIVGHRGLLFEFMNANVDAVFEYALGLTRVTSLTDFVELSTNHARRNVDRIVLQTAELGWFAVSSFQRMTAVLTGSV